MFSKPSIAPFFALLIAIAFQTVHAADLAPENYDIYSADYNGDGLEDLVFSPKQRILIIAADVNIPIDYSEQPLVFTQNQDGTYTALYPADAAILSSLSLNPLSHELLFGDFNGDGYLDILFQSFDNGSETFIAYGNGLNNSVKGFSFFGKQGYALTAANIEAIDSVAGYTNIRITFNDGQVASASGSANGISLADLVTIQYAPGSEMAPMITGSFQADDSGAATYSIPIELPPVPSGVMPEISLNYSSMGGNGYMGLGWSLDAESAITRCPTNLIDDGFSDPVDFDENDQFCLDGSRLILASGVHGQGGAEYRLESNPQTIVRAHGVLDDGPLWFEVLTSKGLVSIYGDTLDSRVRALGDSGNVLTWNINRTHNVYGDGVDYKYNNPEPGEDRYVTSIRYGESDLEYTVNFEYEDVDLVFVGYVAPSSVTSLSKRLVGVSVEQGTALLSKYAMEYGEIQGEAVLEKINLSNVNGEQSLPLLFGWNNLKQDNAPLFSGSSLIDSQASFSSDVKLALAQSSALMNIDLDADGVDELVSFRFQSAGEECTPPQIIIGVLCYLLVDVSMEVANYDSAGGLEVDFKVKKLAQMSQLWSKTAESARNAQRLSIDQFMSSIKVGDFNGDGRNQIYRVAYAVHDGLVQHNSDSFEEYRLNSQGDIEIKTYESEFISKTTWNVDYDSVSASNHMFVGDFNADGRSDLFLSRAAGVSSTDIIYFSKEDGSFESVASVGGPNLQNPNSSNSTNVAKSSLYASRLKFGDFNGDGKTDIFKINSEVDTLYFSNGDGTFTSLQSGYSTYNNLDTISVSIAPLGSTTAEALRDVARVSVGDFNGDGLSDLYVIYGSESAYPGGIFLSRGDGYFKSLISIQNPGPQFYIHNGGIETYVGNLERANKDMSRLKFADLNGDGRTDIYKVNGNASGTATDVIYLANADGSFVNAKTMPGKKTVVASGVKAGMLDLSLLRFANLNADSKLDIYSITKGTNTPDHIYYNQHTTPVITHFPDGLQTYTEVTYEHLTATANYTPGSANDDIDNDGQPDGYPIINATPRMQVVTQLKRENGAGGYQYTEFNYEGYRSLNGRGSLGFAKVTSRDVNLGVRTETQYNQNYTAYTEGMVDVASTFHVDPDTEIETQLDRTVNTNSVMEYSLPITGEVIRTSYLEEQTVENWDYDSKEKIGQVHSHYQYDAEGNLDIQTTTTTDPLTGEQFITIKDSDYYPAQDSPIYLAGLVKKVTSQSGTPEIPIGHPDNYTRVVEYEYTNNGEPKYQFVEPGHAMALKTEFVYSVQGQITSTITSTPGNLGDPDIPELAPRAATVEYYDNGYEWKKINALGHTTELIYHNTFPWLLTKTIDQNGLEAETIYDDWGRAHTTITPDQNSVTTKSYWCDGNCEEGELFYTKSTPNIGKPSFVFFDKHGREVRKSAYGFDGSSTGRLVHVRTEYNELGKVARHSEPHFDGDTLYWTETYYDKLGRMSVAYDANGAPMIEVGVTARERTSINALGQRKVIRTNVIGQTVEVEDNLGGITQFQYGPFGKLTLTKDAEGVETTMQYDIFGNKIYMNDASKGEWTYKYDSYGQLRKQTDAEEQATWFDYDVLGRMITRIDDYQGTNEQTATWVYDTAPMGDTGQALGMVHSVSQGQYQESHRYDSQGRSIETNIAIDGIDYKTQSTYDSYGRADTVTYPFNPQSPGELFVIKNNYHAELGVLNSISNPSSGMEYWELKKTTARGQAELVQLGDWLMSSRSFNEQTGHLENLLTYDPVNNPGQYYQNLEYQFDAIGNMMYRTDHVQNVTQSVEQYDGLNRIKHVSYTLPDPANSYSQTLDYGKTGNINYKSGVGTYTYGSSLVPAGYANFCAGYENNAGPQAVSHVVGDIGDKFYCYDKNGNLVKDSDRNIEYTNFGKPSLISKGANNQVQFFYGPNRARYKRVDIESGNTSTTHILGGYEKVISSAGTTHKYYVGGFALVTKKNNDPLKTQFLLKDHQGSVTATVNNGEAPNQATYFAYDAWGKRIHADWRQYLSDDHSALADPIMNRGYTGHEHIDSMGLIHMNGRVYDPVLSRFLSADPYVQDITNSQSYNRYSYVINNPLSYTDPSGFFWKKIKKAFKKIVKAFKKVVKAVAAVALAPFELARRVHHKMWDFTKKALQNKYIAAIAQIAACINPATCVMAAMAISAVATYGATGEWGMALKAGFTAAATSIVSMGMNKMIGQLNGFVSNTLAHGVGGAAMAKLQGGSAKSGFISGFMGALASNSMSTQNSNGGRTWRSWANNAGKGIRTAVSTIAGALGAKWSGGDAALGALNAGMAHLYNSEGHTKGASEEISAVGVIKKEFPKWFKEEVVDLSKWQGAIVGITGGLTSCKFGICFGLSGTQVLGTDGRVLGTFNLDFGFGTSGFEVYVRGLLGPNNTVDDITHNAISFSGASARNSAASTVPVDSSGRSTASPILEGGWSSSKGGSSAVWSYGIEANEDRLW